MPAVTDVSRTVSLPLLAHPEPDLDMADMLGRDARLIPVRQSSFSDMFCARYFAFKHRFGLVRTDYKSARDTGTFGHTMLQHLYLGKGREEAEAELDAYRDQLLHELFEANMLGLNEASLVKQIEADSSKAKVMALVYWNRFALDPERFQVIAVELGFRVEFDSGSHTLEPGEGTIDLAVWDRLKNEIWIIDHKFTKNAKEYQETAAFDPQSRLYRVGLSAWVRTGELTVLATGEPVPADTPVVGIRFNAMVPPTIKHKAKQTFDEYLAEVRDWYAAEGDHEGTTTGGPNALPQPYAHRFTEPLFPEEFVVQLDQHSRWSSARTLTRNFPKTCMTKFCRDQYGSPCQYREFCNTDPRLWQRLANRMYPQEQTA